MIGPILYWNFTGKGFNPLGVDVFVWDGSAQDGDLSTAANWVGGAAPQAGAVLVFNDGDEDVTSWGSGPTTFSGIRIGWQYTGNFTLPSIGTIDEFRINKRVGAVSTTSVSITRLYVTNTPSGSSPTVTFTLGATTNAYISGTSGPVRFSAHAITNLYMFPAPNNVSRVELILGAVTLLRAAGNSFIEKSTTNPNTIWLSGGNSSSEYTADFDSTGSPTYSEVNVASGATLKYRDAGIITTLNVWGDVIMARTQAESVTITNATQYSGTLDIDGPATVTMTNNLNYLGGVYNPPLTKTVNLA